MANLFDATNAPEGAPERFVVGDFLQWKRSDIAADYSPDTHTATYVARITASRPREIQIAGTNGTDHYLFTVSSATSGAFVAGSYHWQLEIEETSSGNRIVVDQSSFEILPDLDAALADPRGHAAIMVAKIESILEGKADSDVSNYSIAGRSIGKMSFDELMAARDRYRAEVVRIDNAAAQARGKAGVQAIKVRF